MATSPAQERASVTIARIAAETGVSVATVSKVLNGRTDVSAATRARVEASLAQHRYQRRTRRQESTHAQVELVFHEYGGVWAMEIIRGVEEAASRGKVGLVLSQLRGEHHPPQQWLDGVLARRPLGVIFVMSDVAVTQGQQLLSRSIPFVIVDTAGETPASVPTVGSNNWNGGLLATRHLLELGHRRIAVISGPTDVLCSRARIAGYRSAHDERELPVRPELIRHGNFRIEAGLEHGLELLNLPQRPTAIFAGSDIQAFGVLKAARRLGLRVPEDLSVVGYDNLPIAEWAGPSLTTVHQPLHDMAGTATRMLLDLARGITPATTRVDLATELVVRDSTAPPAPN